MQALNISYSFAIPAMRNIDRLSSPSIEPMSPASPASTADGPSDMNAWSPTSHYAENDPEVMSPLAANLAENVISEHSNASTNAFGHTAGAIMIRDYLVQPNPAPNASVFTQESLQSLQGQSGSGFRIPFPMTGSGIETSYFSTFQNVQAGNIQQRDSIDGAEHHSMPQMSLRNAAYQASNPSMESMSPGSPASSADDPSNMNIAYSRGLSGTAGVSPANEGLDHDMNPTSPSSVSTISSAPPQNDTEPVAFHEVGMQPGYAIEALPWWERMRTMFGTQPRM